MQALQWIASLPGPKQFFSVEEIQNNLKNLCIPSGQPARGSRISEKSVRGIQFHLKLLDDRVQRAEEERWAQRPRLYAILHKISAIHLLDAFIKANITDFNLPFNQQTLPLFVDETAGRGTRSAFLAVQDYYLTDAKDIESEKSKHLHLSSSGDDHFVPKRILGQGGHAGVDLVYSRLSTELYARKRVWRHRGSENSERYLIQELRELRRLHHRHLVQIIGSYTDPEYIAYLMRPVAECTLEEYFSQSRYSNLQEYKHILRRFFGCLAGAMNYLYTNRLRHRDLSSRNILVDEHGQVYISDFGSSYNWASKPTSRTRHRNIPASPDYMAPELDKGDEHGTKSDMWSLGIVFLEMTTKLLGQKPSEMRKRIQDAAFKAKTPPFPYANMAAVSSWIDTLGKTTSDSNHDKEPLVWLRELLHKEHEHRPTPPQLVKFILESPSFGTFCCVACQGEFQTESFAYGPGAMCEQDNLVDSEETRAAVEGLFMDPSSQPFGGMSSKKTGSIERWLDSNFETTTSFGPDTVNSAHDDQLLYNTVEWEIYDTSSASNALNSSEVPVRERRYSHASSYETAAEVPGAGDLSMSHANPDGYNNDQDHRRSNGGKTLRDSGLGFLEYESNSSDGDEVAHPFEEISDRSSTVSGGEDAQLSAGHFGDPLASILFGDAIKERGPGSPVQMLPALSPGASDLLFEEEQDVSDDSNPWDEASDRSDTEDKLEPELSSRVEPANDGMRPVQPDIVKDQTNGLPPSTIPPAVKRVSSMKATVTDDIQDYELVKPKRVTKKAIVSDDVEYIEPDLSPSPPPAYAADDSPEPTVSLNFAFASTLKGLTDNITQRNRSAVIPLDVQRLMDNTWGMASSAPTSVMSERTRSRIKSFLFLIPSPKQIEDVLSFHCQKGSASAVKTILSQILSPNKRLKHRQFFHALLYAIKGGSTRHNKCVRELLAAGVNPNHRSKKTGLTPLQIALDRPNFKGYANLIWILLSSEPRKTNPDGTDLQGEVPLSKLFVGADEEPLEAHKRGALIMLLKAGADPNYQQPGTGNSLLHLAVRRKDPVVTAILLHVGVDVNALNSSGISPLQVTAAQFHRRQGGEEVLDHLLKNGAEVDQPAGALERTALHWAVIAGNTTAIHRLLAAGADVTKKDKQNRDAFILAVKHTKKVFISRIGDDEPGQAVREAEASDHIEIMQGLLEKVPDEYPIKGFLEEGKCAIETAAGEKTGGLLRKLLKMGLDLDARYKGGKTVREFLAIEGGAPAKTVLMEWEPAQA
ncbi:ankyrin repeat protein [Triangularia verruculosa]|uniref:EKC/KEOPS complex subunit BUD32 n=1 Tax=Triangularia verruculosa TaxID=2587418 RepID=A0AAN6XSY5_9PEZI|nr:ankyrin repeat protein [Triangularia verruculosa]